MDPVSNASTPPFSRALQAKAFLFPTSSSVDPRRLTQRSPLIRIFKLCTLIRIFKLCTLLRKLFVALTIVTLMLFSHLSISNPTVAAKMNSNAGITPFKTVNQILAIPTKVMGQTKDVVASNDERVADLDNVIRPSAAQEKKRSRAEGLPPCHPSHLPTPLPPMLRPVPSAKFSTSPFKSSTKPKL
jgi:hypothetical protein